jgi:hypothetical protein
MQVIHQTAGFVLVQERVAYYDHRHSGIDETNILQVVKAVEGETIQLLFSSETFEWNVKRPLVAGFFYTNQQQKKYITCTLKKGNMS